jgi:hypothetical protein
VCFASLTQSPIQLQKQTTDLSFCFCLALFLKKPKQNFNCCFFSHAFNKFSVLQLNFNIQNRSHVTSVSSVKSVAVGHRVSNSFNLQGKFTRSQTAPKKMGQRPTNGLFPSSSRSRGHVYKWNGRSTRLRPIPWWDISQKSFLRLRYCPTPRLHPQLRTTIRTDIHHARSR